MLRVVGRRKVPKADRAQYIASREKSSAARGQPFLTARDAHENLVGRRPWRKPFPRRWIKGLSWCPSENSENYEAAGWECPQESGRYVSAF